MDSIKVSVHSMHAKGLTAFHLIGIVETIENEEDLLSDCALSGIYVQLSRWASKVMAGPQKYRKMKPHPIFMNWTS